MSRANPSHEPLSISLVHRMVMDGFKAGAALAAESADVRSAAPSADWIHEAFPDTSIGTAEREVQSILERCPEPEGDREAELHQLMGWSIEAALILGARAVAAAAEDGASGEALRRLAGNELWHEERVDEFLLQVVEAIVARRIPLLGAERYLRRRTPFPEVEVTECHRDEGLEIRTGWIRDADTCRPYQIRMERQGDQLLLSRRLQGARSFDPLSAIPSHDLDILVAVLQQGADASVVVP